jgi:hypothetical protein
MIIPSIFQCDRFSLTFINVKSPEKQHNKLKTTGLDAVEKFTENQVIKVAIRAAETSIRSFQSSSWGGNNLPSHHR